MNGANSGVWVGAGLLIVLAVVGAYDLYATTTDGRVQSVTSVVREWSARWPIIPFAAGLLAGHLFWGR